MIGAQVHGADALVKEHGDLLRYEGWVGREDDAGHGVSLWGRGWGHGPDARAGGPRLERSGEGDPRPPRTL